MSLVDVMISVGGLTDFADGNRAYISRIAEDGKRVQLGVRLEDLLRGGDSTANAGNSSGRCTGHSRKLFLIFSAPPMGGVFVLMG